MPSTKPKPETKAIFIKRTFNAPREQVFRAWTRPDELMKWFGPEGFTTHSADVDLRIGGNYRIGLRPPEGEVFYHQGTYREIDPPEKLTFTWLLEDQDCAGSQNESAETLVTVEFRDLGAATEVSLTHEFLPSEKAREGHEYGWNGCFDSLARKL